MDLICFSHIRWDFVYQRPQHLLTRFAFYNRVFIIEESLLDGKSNYYDIVDQKENNVFVIKLYLSRELHEDQKDDMIRRLIDAFMSAKNIHQYILWYYTPMALAYSGHLQPKLTVYDCMDELSAFKFAHPELKKYEARLFSLADLVFTGGHSLYEAKKHLHQNIYPFPSSIDKAHFVTARNELTQPADQKDIPYPRIGFYGVIDERLHIKLIEQMADMRPDWHFILIGPVIKIDPATLPQRNNIHYLGGKEYQELPVYLSGWDIAMLPFEINESTKYISPTKTPEYLAGGKPVISTPITDVVNPYGQKGLVHIADNATGFIDAAEKIFACRDNKAWLKAVDEFLADMSWNNTWHQMSELMENALAKKSIDLVPKIKAYV
ncbi:glycosyltransferase family 1 protein [Ginsengibacter hankyongi]|uniref:Glycosyltransferase family 1 protein n=1 Tax=Ginsengibacter hankyongi TaxID=2607284 RepID=A0A5J5IFM8_9BACT|nr:glycosyltransferase family 1 protein [Ginsengibacter hankyongi]KAA9038569.1 glycosyltransferase family 1 protein [Ginsengibacter hankyongi]